MITIVGSVVEGIINLVPAHILEQSKSKTRKTFLRTQLSTCHDFIVH